MRAVYATVEKMMRASDVKASAYAGPELLAAIESASEDVDALVKLGDSQRPAFAPWVGTIVFDWPFANNTDSYRFWLNQFRLTSITSVISGGVDITASALGWPASAPVYSALDIDTEGSDSLEIGSGTGQRSLSITGTWGTPGRDDSRSAWTLGGAVNASATTWTINAPIGVGSLVLAGTERVIVLERAWADSGQTAAALTANLADAIVSVQTGSAFLAGEEITIDGEIMLVRDVIGNTLAVQRAASGSTLAAHGAASAVYWKRSCTVERGALGTSAASQSSGAVLSIYRPPALVEQLTIAYALDRRAQENVGYARDLSHIQDRRGLSAKAVGRGVDAIGIGALQQRVIDAYGRIRHRAI
jgi:hypothetical protein